MAKKRKHSIRRKESDNNRENKVDPPSTGPKQSATTEKPSPVQTTSPSDVVQPSRRQFITRSSQVIVGMCALGSSAAAVRMALPDFTQGQPSIFPLGRPADFAMNTVTWLRERDLFIMRNEIGVGAFSSRCTHLGCTVRRTGDGFVCPCHGARYGLRGEVVSGPQRTPLPWFHIWIEPDGRLWVDTNELSEISEPESVSLPEDESQ